MSQIDPSPHSLPQQGNPAVGSGKSKGRKSLTSRFISWLVDDPGFTERRRRPRVPAPPLRAYLGVFGSTQSIPVANISSTGFYLYTDDHWLPGTEMPLRLERTDRLGFAALHRLTVPARVVRTGSDGVGFSFIISDLPAPLPTPVFESDGGWQGERWADRKLLEDLVTELEAVPDSSN